MIDYTEDNLLTLIIKKYVDICYFPYTDEDQFYSQYHIVYNEDLEKLSVSNDVIQTIKECEKKIVIVGINVTHAYDSRRLLVIYFQEEHILELFDIYGYDLWQKKLLHSLHAHFVKNYIPVQKIYFPIRKFNFNEEEFSYYSTKCLSINKEIFDLWNLWYLDRRLKNIGKGRNIIIKQLKKNKYLHSKEEGSFKHFLMYMCDFGSKVKNIQNRHLASDSTKRISRPLHSDTFLSADTFKDYLTNPPILLKNAYKQAVIPPDGLCADGYCYRNISRQDDVKQKEREEGWIGGRLGKLIQDQVANRFLGKGHSQLTRTTENNTEKKLEAAWKEAKEQTIKIIQDSINDSDLSSSLHANEIKIKAIKELKNLKYLFKETEEKVELIRAINEEIQKEIEDQIIEKDKEVQKNNQEYQINWGDPMKEKLEAIKNEMEEEREQTANFSWLANADQQNAQEKYYILQRYRNNVEDALQKTNEMHEKKMQAIVKRHDDIINQKKAMQSESGYTAEWMKYFIRLIVTKKIPVEQIKYIWDKLSAILNRAFVNNPNVNVNLKALANNDPEQWKTIQDIVKDTMHSYWNELKFMLMMGGGIAVAVPFVSYQMGVRSGKNSRSEKDT